MTKAIPADRTLNTVTADEWRSADSSERWAFLSYWQTRGIVSFLCLNCAFPMDRGVALCEACRDDPPRYDVYPLAPVPAPHWHK